MASKPKKVVDMKDPRTFSQPGAYEAIKAIAEANDWTNGFAVAMTAAHFEPKMPNSVTAADIEKAKAEIVVRGLAQKGRKQTEAKKEASGGYDRFPFTGEGQENWDIGRWKELKYGARMTFGGLRGRFKAEIVAGQEISTVQVDEYQKELEVKQAEYLELLDEKPDVDATGPATCGAPEGFHKGVREFQDTQRYKRGELPDGSVYRQTHKGGNEAILVGNHMVVEEGEEPKAIPYCHTCRKAVWDMIGNAKNQLPVLQAALAKASGEDIARLKIEIEEVEQLAETRVNFYTRAGAKRKLDAIKQGVEGHAGVLGHLKGASKSSFGGQYGSRKTWKTEGPSRHRGR